MSTMRGIGVDPNSWIEKFKSLTATKPINTIGKTRYSSGVAGATNAASKGSMFSKANLAKTSAISGGLQILGTGLSKLLSKESKGQVGVSNDPNSLANLLQIKPGYIG